MDDVYMYGRTCFLADGWSRGAGAHGHAPGHPPPPRAQQLDEPEPSGPTFPAPTSFKHLLHAGATRGPLPNRALEADQAHPHTARHKPVGVSRDH